MGKSPQHATKTSRAETSVYSRRELRFAQPCRRRRVNHFPEGIASTVNYIMIESDEGVPVGVAGATVEDAAGCAGAL